MGTKYLKRGNNLSSDDHPPHVLFITSPPHLHLIINIYTLVQEGSPILLSAGEDGQVEG